MSKRALWRRGRLWLPALLVATFVLLNAGGYWFYRRTEASLVETVGRRLVAATTLVAARIDPELLLAAADSLFDPDAYIYVDTTIAGARQSGGFAGLVLFHADGREWLAQEDDETDPAAAAMVLAAGAAFEAACLGVPSRSSLYRSRGDFFLAACVPVHHRDSGIVAILAAEAGNDYFEALEELSLGLWLLDLFAGGVLLVVGLALAGVERRLARAEQAALRASQLAAMGQMVATVAHELKNPLGIIKNSAERIRSRYGRPGEPLFDFIPQEVDRLDGLLRRYLQFARLEVGPARPVELRPLLDQLVENLGGRGQDAGIALEIPPGTAVAADEGALRQVLLNLLLNARQACAGHAAPRIRVAAVGAGRRVTITVSDNGAGMDADTLERAREPFFTTRADGSGLGIYLAHTLTEKMGGRLGMDSRPGTGTVVTLTLPRATEV